MEEKKVIVDRARLSSEYIAKHQNFKQVLDGYRVTKPPLWKSKWFYGPVGLATVALTLAASKFNPLLENEKGKIYETKITLKEPKNTKQEDTKTHQAHAVLSELPVEDEITEEKKSTNVKTLENSSGIEEQATKKLENGVDEEMFTVENIEVASHQKEEKDDASLFAELPGVPKIGGIFNGNVHIDLLCSSGKIELRNGWEVESYMIQYYNGEDDVVEKFDSNILSSKLCADIKRYNINLPVNITRIVAVNKQGGRKLLPSMQIIPIL